MKENFDKTLSYDEGQADKFYLFVTSTQLETLKRLKESGQLLISFNQQFGDLNIENYTGAVSMGLDEINSNAITFGTWEEVYDGGENPNFIGYKIWYQINQVHSIQCLIAAEIEFRLAVFPLLSDLPSHLSLLRS